VNATARADLLIRGEVVLAASPAGLETVEAVGIVDGRVVAAGAWDDVRSSAAPGARIVDARGTAVIPGLHDAHIHLVGLARTRRSVVLDGARDAGEIADRLGAASVAAGRDAWVTGRGWTEASLGTGTDVLEAAVHGRPAFVFSHDGHSAWASAEARRRAGLDRATHDPAGGRIERDATGEPTGVLRETALDLVAAIVEPPQRAALRAPLDETLRELAGLGITGATEAGDYTDRHGVGADAAFGDSYSSLTDLGDLVDGRLRMTLGIPAAAITAAAARGFRTGAPIPERRTMRHGWAKAYADGALGSGTAALLAPRTCGDGDAGILRLDADALDALFAKARPAIAMAIHAIGDRAARAVLDAVERAPVRSPDVPADRVEHAQLVDATDAGRFSGLGVTASVQPIHAASDRDLVESCWGGRQDGAYAWRRLRDGGALLIGGSDAPVESVNPWLGLFAAVHRRFPRDRRDDWRSGQALTPAEALAAYTTGPAMAIGAPDEGHLRPGARADLAVLSIDLATLLRCDEAVAEARSEMTLIDGREVASI
jgi:predicted amidohydrolase YtcJ